MSMDNIETVLRQLENFIELWKQLNQYFQLAANGKFTAEDESQFLEVKSLLTQELELVLASLEERSPSRAEVHAVIASVPSLHFLQDARDDTLRSAENQWHRLYISWQAILGQLKVEQRAKAPAPRFKWFRGK